MDQPEPPRERARRHRTVRVYRLGGEPGDDLSAVSTPEQRLDMVVELSRRMWALTGRPLPSYSRGSMPGRVIRPS